jgi:hypothetical protein
MNAGTSHCPGDRGPNQPGETVNIASIDDLFGEQLVTAVPSLTQRNSDKAPGDCEDKGDHRASVTL